MEGRGGVGVKNIQRKMNYPLPSGGGNKNQLEQTTAPKRKAQKAWKKDRRMRCFREKGL